MPDLPGRCSNIYRLSLKLIRFSEHWNPHENAPPGADHSVLSGEQPSSETLRKHPPLIRPKSFGSLVSGETSRTFDSRSFPRLRYFKHQPEVPGVFPALGGIPGVRNPLQCVERDNRPLIIIQHCDRSPGQKKICKAVR